MNYTKDSAFIKEIIEKASRCDNIIIDGFCGLGGVTEGFEKADNFYVIACINHWHEAIRCHQSNHPHCLHLEEDFRSADISLIVYMVNEIRKRNPNVKVHIWLSLECVNFSIAKGGMSRDADSRTLAEHADRYVININPDILWIENVKEFMTWGPLIPKVKLTDEGYQICPLVINKKKKIVSPWMIPDPAHKGRDFKKWCKHISSFGYDKHQRLINMADYGVPQHRVRLIMQFTRLGIECIYPEPTHDKLARNGLPKWLPVRGCLDLKDEGESVISYRISKTGVVLPRIRSGKTIDRLIAGCKKHVLGKNHNQFMAKAYSGNDNDKVTSLDHPSGAITGTGGNLSTVTVESLNQWIVKPNSACNNKEVSKGSALGDISPAVTCYNGLNLATADMVTDPWIVKFLSNNPRTGINSGQSIDEASPTACGQNRLAIASAKTILNYNHSSSDESIDDPSRPILTHDKYALQSTHLLSLYYGQGGQDASIENPCPVIPTKDRVIFNTVKYIDQYYSGGDQHKSVDEVSGSVTAVPKQRVVDVTRFVDNQFGVGSSTGLDDPSCSIQANPKQNVVEVSQIIMDTQFGNECHDLDQPARTITANRKHFYLVNFQWNAASFVNIDKPSNTIIARMDKAPNYLMVTEEGDLAIEVYDHEPEHIVKLKKFMAENGILDIRMRMLNKRELKRIMTLPVDYKLTGTDTDQKKMIGNAVPSHFVTALANAYEKQNKFLEQAIA